MRLVKLKISNYRCYSEEIVCDFDDLTAITGANDAGKSTLLEALDIFFNDNGPDKDDYSVGGAGTISITCEFDELPNEIIIDANFPTSLALEHLLNSNGKLELKKIYGDASPKLKKIVACAQHPTAEGYSDLLRLKRTELIARAEELGVDLSSVNQSINASIRQAIWGHADDLEIDNQEVLLQGEKAAEVKEDAKKVWERIKGYLPAFALFKSDRASTDKDSEAQDPLNAAIKDALKAKEAELEEIKAHVLSEVSNVANDTVEKLKEMDARLANELNPKFENNLKWSNVFKASITGDDDIPFNKRGSGVKRLILLNFFRAKAEKDAFNDKKQNIIYAVEEPETSQHPNNQRLLIKAFTDLTANHGCQVVLTSHTPMLVRSIPDNKIRYIEVSDVGARSVLKASDENNAKFTKSLGVIPDNGVKIFVGVEGPNDMNFLRNVSRTLSQEDASIPNLEAMEDAGELIFFPLGGSTLALWCSRLQHLNRPEFHLFDRDTVPPAPPHYQNEVDEINGRENTHALSTNKREIENYVHSEAIQSVYSNNGMNIDIPEFDPHENIPLEVAKILHTANSDIDWETLTLEKKKKKESSVKKVICDQAAREMSLVQIEQIDPDGEIRSWLQQISRMIEPQIEQRLSA